MPAGPAGSTVLEEDSWGRIKTSFQNWRRRLRRFRVGAVFMIGADPIQALDIFNLSQYYVDEILARLYVAVCFGWRGMPETL